MINQLKEANRLNETLFLGVISLTCFALSVFRFVYTDTRTFLFLNWNLFLAFIPWFFSSILAIYPRLRKRKLAVTLLISLWLLFFPNAPYILTDLFHLRWNTSMPLWFDLVLILSFAWTGLLFGILSLWDIEKILAIRIHRKVLPLITACLLFLGSFGIYIGRYLRWNSWDILVEPHNLFYDIGESIISPFLNRKALGMTLFMGLFLNIVYWSFHLIRKKKD
jgi:uncharacterized membrane protein